MRGRMETAVMGLALAVALMGGGLSAHAEEAGAVTDDAGQTAGAEASSQAVGGVDARVETDAREDGTRAPEESAGIETNSDGVVADSTSDESASGPEFSDASEDRTTAAGLQGDTNAPSDTDSAEMETDAARDGTDAASDAQAPIQDDGADTDATSQVPAVGEAEVSDGEQSDDATVSAQSTTRQSMHRLYNPNSGEHFYTADRNEALTIVYAGWRYEGVGWMAPTAGDPVYRLYNPNAGDHHYTTSTTERDWLASLGWRYEGVGWNAASSSFGTPIYRQYNPNAKSGTHNFTLSKEENDYLVKIGWRFEGIAWWGDTDQSSPEPLTFDSLSGIDIASYQKGISIPSLSADFVIVKASEGLSYPGTGNSYYYTYKQWAGQTLAAGKKLGFYHFFRADSSATDQARHFVNMVGSYVGKAVLALDYENTTGSDVISKGPSFAKQFLDEVYRLTGVRPVLYASRSVVQSQDWSAVSGAGYKLWLAQYLNTYYPDKGNGSVNGFVINPTLASGSFGSWDRPTIYQYTSVGKLPSYSGKLDFDYFYGKRSDWDALASKS